MDSPSVTTFTMKNTTPLDKTPLLSSNNQTSASVETPGILPVVWSVFCPLVLVLGCFGNVMTMVVMRSMRASQSTACLAVYFTALAVSDLLLLCSLVFWFWPQMAFDTPLIYFHDISCTCTLFVTYSTAMTSAWVLVAMTCQRLTSVIVPHRVGVLCTVRTGKIITATIVLISCAANIHFFFQYRVKVLEDGTLLCVSNIKLLLNFFAYFDLCVASVLPFLLLFIANSVLIYQIMKSVQAAGKLTVSDQQQTASRSAQVSSMTTTLIATSAVFLLLSLPTCIATIYLEEVGYYDGEVTDDSWLEELVLLDTVGALLWVSNSAVNFYIYILSGSRFRQEAKKYLCLVFKHHQ